MSEIPIRKTMKNMKIYEISVIKIFDLNILKLNFECIFIKRCQRKNELVNL